MLCFLYCLYTYYIPPHLVHPTNSLVWSRSESECSPAPESPSPALGTRGFNLARVPSSRGEGRRRRNEAAGRLGSVLCAVVTRVEKRRGGTEEANPYHLPVVMVVHVWYARRRYAMPMPLQTE